MIATGTYRHYKGKYYQVIGLATHSETFEELVVYYCLYPNATNQLWVRPLSMFQETVEVDGKKVQRFTFVEKVIE